MFIKGEVLLNDYHSPNSLNVCLKDQTSKTQKSSDNRKYNFDVVFPLIKHIKVKRKIYLSSAMILLGLIKP